MKISCFDAHCDTLWRCWDTGEELRHNGGQLDLERGKAMERYAQFFAMYHDAKYAPPDGMWAQLQRLHEIFLRQTEKNADLISPCRTGEEVDAAIEAGKIAGLLSIEGADLLECDPCKVAEVADWGVRLINPVWNRANVLSGTNVEEPERGLSPQGRDFVRAMEERNIFVDVSHLSDAGFWDLANMTHQPIVASHSNARSVWNHPRNLTDDMFHVIRDTGGVVGINAYTAFVGEKASMEELVAHIEHFLSLDGEKTLCLGGDLDGCEALAGGMQGLQDVPHLYEALQQRGYSRQLLEDIFWNNLRRLI